MPPAAGAEEGAAGLVPVPAAEVAAAGAEAAGVDLAGVAGVPVTVTRVVWVEAPPAALDAPGA